MNERDIQDRVLGISQRGYLLDLLVHFNMLDCEPSSFAMETLLQVEKPKELQRTSKPYKELMGCLMTIRVEW